MSAKNIRPLVLGILLLFLSAGVGNATAPVTGEEALFTTSVAPDALLLLDLSGSMAWNPAGGGDIWGNTSCSGTFYGSSGSGHTVNCSRLAIAKRSIFDILDDNDDNTINSSDEGSLGVRLGYMQYYNCSGDDTGGDYTSGCIQIPGSGGSRRYINSKYSQIYCNSNTSCTVGSTGSNSVGGASASGGTPLASALGEARIYLNAHKAADSAGACRQKFVILVTDGSDTYACGASGAECASHRYKNRRESVARAKALADAGYKVFVIGFGSTMPPYLQNTLNWMAYYGGTDNPNATNAGSTTGYSITTGCDVSTSPVTNPTACCDMSTNPMACFPTGVTSCMTDSAAVTDICYDATNPYPGAGNSTSSFRASANDPGYENLSGYAFLAADADQLATALKTAINLIREATYSFSQASVQAQRTQDENFIYEGSFQPVTGDPFWLGHLKKYQINTDGTVGSVLWDAGTILQSAAASSRTIKTLIGGVMTDFTTAIAPEYFGLASGATAARNAVVGYFRGESGYNPDNWKLGDVFRSTPITVGTPNPSYYDRRDSTNAFASHSSNHVRASSKGNRLITVGANDGQMHAFKTSDGTEAWSFIPPNLLPKLKSIAHATEPTLLTHLYFVDGMVSVADVWLGSGDGTTKAVSDWHTVMMFGEGRGSGPSYLWSSSQHCDTGFSGSVTYSASYPHYCGYYALDVTGTSCTASSGSCTPPQPTYMWRLGGTSGIPAAYGPYLAEPWSKFRMGKVLIGGNEKWVGFVGGGGGTDNSKGNGFFVVDLSNGNILWGFTHANNAAMDYGLVATPSPVDTDNDGFIDTVYIGDRGDNMWRFKFCRASDGATCNTGNWTGGMLFDSSAGSSIRPIFTTATVAYDDQQNLWVYFGTGDKNDPTAPNAQEKFVGLKDNDRSTTYNYGNLENITSTSSIAVGTGDGWYMNLPGNGEKILADPTVYGGVVYFTTYTPPTGGDPCAQGGTANLYGVNYTTGAGEIDTGSGDSRTVGGGVGSGIPSAPIVSLKPGSSLTPDLYVTTSGGGGTGANTQRVNFNPNSPALRNQLRFWHDMRVQ